MWPRGSSRGSERASRNGCVGIAVGLSRIRFAVVVARTPIMVPIVAAAVVLGAMAPPSHASPPPREGVVRPYWIASRHQHRDRRIWVYQPPGDGPTRNGPDLGLIVAFDGGEYIHDMPLPRTLDSLILAHAIPPQIAVMIDDSSFAARLDDLANRAWFVDWIGNEVIPWVRARWPVSHDPRRAIITGSSAGGLAATYIALSRPDLFGNVFAQSGAFWRGAEASNDPPWEWLVARARAWPRRAVRFRLEVGDTEIHGALNGRAPSILAAHRTLRDVLRAKGYSLTYAEIPGGVHGPETWAARLPAGIASLAAPPR